MNERQQEILERFLEDPEKSLSVGDLLPYFDLDRSSLYRHLTVLSDAGVVVPDGAGKYRRYRLNAESDEYLRWDLKRPPAARKTVPYNPRLLEEYTPNQSFFLSAEQREAMREVGRVEEGDVDKESYRRVLDSLLIDLTHASSNLENVPISWLDTKTLIELGERPEGLNETQLRIVLNHKEAIRFLVENDLDFTRRDLFDIHSMLMGGLIAEQGAEGRLRTKIVGFSDSRYIPIANPHQLSEEFDKFLEKARKIEDPFERSFFALTFIAYLQPFQDGNKRTSRLATNLPLIQNRLAPFSFSDIRKSDYMFGLLAFYERGRPQFLASAFHASYLKTAPRYQELMHLIQEGGILSTLAVDDHRPQKPSGPGR